VTFIELLAEQNIFCLTGTVVELPGYFRISLTANEGDRISAPWFRRSAAQSDM
jgi:hypothetical protein